MKSFSPRKRPYYEDHRFLSGEFFEREACRRYALADIPAIEPDMIMLQEMNGAVPGTGDCTILVCPSPSLDHWEGQDDYSTVREDPV